MKKLKKKKGFTLVELLAVIIIIGIIMVLAVPSVMSTVESARKKSFLEYVDKIFSVGKSKWLLYSSKAYPQPGQLNYYMFDLEEDLGLDNLGDYKGIFIVMECDNDECYWTNDDYLGGDIYMVRGEVHYLVGLINQNFNGAYDFKNNNRIVKDTDLDFYNMVINSQKSTKEIYTYLNFLTKCNTLSQVAVDIKNNNVIQENESHKSNWVNNMCTNYTDEESLALFSNFLIS